MIIKMKYDDAVHTNKICLQASEQSKSKRSNSLSQMFMIMMIMETIMMIFVIS